MNRRGFLTSGLGLVALTGCGIVQSDQVQQTANHGGQDCIDCWVDITCGSPELARSIASELMQATEFDLSNALGFLVRADIGVNNPNKIRCTTQVFSASQADCELLLRQMQDFVSQRDPQAVFESDFVGIYHGAPDSPDPSWGRKAQLAGQQRTIMSEQGSGNDWNPWG